MHVFSNFDRLTKHVQQCTPIDMVKFVCPSCSKNFGNKHNLEGHMMNCKAIHENVTMGVCKYCGKLMNGYNVRHHEPTCKDKTVGKK